MTDSHDTKADKGIHTASSIGTQCFPYTHITDEVRHVLSIPAVRHVLSHVIEQDTLTTQMLREIQEVACEVGMFRKTFADLLLIALCPEKSVQHSTANRTPESNDESKREAISILPIPVHLRNNRRTAGRKPKRLEISAHEKEQLTPFLTARETEVLSLRSGVKPCSHKVIAMDLHMSTAGIALIEKRVLAKLASLNAGILPNKKQAREKPKVTTPHAKLHNKPVENQDDASTLDSFFQELERERILALAQEEKGESLRGNYLLDSAMENAKKQYPSELRGSIDLVDLCFYDARKPLLTRQEEQELFQAIEEARHMGNETQTRELIHKAVCANMRFAISVALKYKEKGLNLLDVIQEAYIGLIRAADTFESRRGFKFITYAYYWIRQGITKAIANKSRTIRLPRHLNERVTHLGHAFREFLVQHRGTIPTDEELAAMLEWDVDTVAETRILSREQWITSLESPIRSHSHENDSEDTEFGELIEDRHVPQPEECVIKSLTAEKIRGLLVHLPERQEKIIRRRFGIGTNVPESLEEIAQDMGLSRERIRQLEKLALTRLKQYAETLLSY